MDGFPTAVPSQVYPEGVSPNAEDNEKRSLTKAVELLGDIAAGTGGSGLTDAQLRASPFDVNIPNLDGSYDTVGVAVPANAWTYAAALNGIANTTTAVTFKASAGASTRNYVSSIQLYSDALGAATELAIRDGAAGTVLWRTKIGTAGRVNGDPIVFPVPLRGSAATLLEVVTLTASITGAVYFNAQGYVSTV